MGRGSFFWIPGKVFFLSLVTSLGSVPVLSLLHEIFVEYSVLLQSSDSVFPFISGKSCVFYLWTYFLFQSQALYFRNTSYPGVGVMLSLCFNLSFPSAFTVLISNLLLSVSLFEISGRILFSVHYNLCISSSVMFCWSFLGKPASPFVLQPHLWALVLLCACSNWVIPQSGQFWGIAVSGVMFSFPSTSLSLHGWPAVSSRHIHASAFWLFWL